MTRLFSLITPPSSSRCHSLIYKSIGHRQSRHAGTREPSGLQVSCPFPYADSRPDTHYSRKRIWNTLPEKKNAENACALLWCVSVCVVCLCGVCVYVCVCVGRVRMVNWWRFVRQIKWPPASSLDLHTIRPPASPSNPGLTIRPRLRH